MVLIACGFDLVVFTRLFGVSLCLTVYCGALSWFLIALSCFSVLLYCLRGFTLVCSVCLFVGCSLVSFYWFDCTLLLRCLVVLVTRVFCRFWLLVLIA